MPKDETCPVCCEAFSAQRRKPVACNHCQYEACVGCTKRYLLTTHDDPHCMGCRRAYTPDFIDAIFTKAFRTTDLRAHREAVLFEREQRRLPDTQQLLEEREERMKLEERLRQLRVQKRDLDRSISDVSALIRASKAGMQLRHSAPRTAVRTCPRNDCRGYVNDDWVCGLCSSGVCKDCHELLVPNHKCDPDVLASVQLLAKDSRTCPNCPAIIHKIEGCDQMFCLCCHTAFSFETGQIERGVIHNPHFYEWQRATNGGQAPRVPGDDPCRNNNELPWLTVIQQLLREHAEEFEEGVPAMVRHMHRCISSMLRTGRREFGGVTPQEEERAKEALRVRFLQKELTEERFKRLLHRQEQTTEKKRAQAAVLDTFCEVAKEAFNRFVEDRSPHRLVHDVTAMGRLAIEQAAAIEKRFSCKNDRLREWITSVTLQWS